MQILWIACDKGRTNQYYIADEYYYWTMDKNVDDTDLINRAKLSDYEFVKTDERLIVRRKGDASNESA